MNRWMSLYKWRIFDCYTLVINIKKLNNSMLFDIIFLLPPLSYYSNNIFKLKQVSI